jgi:hypothetical protein
MYFMLLIVNDADANCFADMLYTLWKEYIQFRNDYFQSEDFLKAFHNRTLLLTNVPDHLQSPDRLSKFMNSLGLKYPARQALVNPDVDELPKLVAKHEIATREFEKVMCKYLKDPDNVPRERPTVTVNGSGVDAINHYAKKLGELEEQIYALRVKTEVQWKPTASAFASFKSVKGCHSAARYIRTNPAIMTAKTGDVRPPNIKLSPDFDEILWENVSINSGERYTRRLIALGGTIGLTIGWTLFTTFLSTTSDLAKFFDWIPAARDWFLTHPGATGIIQSLLTPILLAVANAVLLPLILRFLTRMQGVSSTHGVEKSVLYKLFAFQVYQVFLFAALPTILAPPDLTNPNITDQYKWRITNFLNDLAKVNRVS